MNSNMLLEYFYMKFLRIEEKEEELFRKMRTKKGLLVLADQLRNLETEKKVVQEIYEEIKPFCQDVRLR